jgi:hypothetical protein
MALPPPIWYPLPPLKPPLIEGVFGHLWEGDTYASEIFPGKKLKNRKLPPFVKKKFSGNFLEN